MKKIEPLPIWHNGVLKNAEYFDIRINNMIFGQSAQFNFSLFTAQETILTEGIGQGELLVNGILDMVGDDYSNWGDNDDYVYTWSADKLNLTII